jgi:peroxiredoxin
VNSELTPGNRFPDFALPDTTGRPVELARLSQRRPLVLAFVRGWWCPKEQVRLQTLVAMQHEIQREYGRIAVVTVDSPYVNGAFRAGLGADFPFLSDEDRALATELDLIELPDVKHRPYLPMTFLLDSALRIHRSWCGFWFRGNPTPEEVRQGLREITRAEQPSYDPGTVWANGGSAPLAAGIDGDVVWIREDDDGREIQRGVWHSAVPEVGAAIARSDVEHRTWRVHRLEEEGGRTAIHMRKDGVPDTNPLPMHFITAPPATKVF